ncbi:putative Suppressor of gene silencing protein [Quillaja saponaria]|uniref:Suppressor of gene silencing protein n=1 Tax=Quillaja saponaria TaxID=32244 RepID=A0AAD7M5T8_QUISA|nr:putative Suppressor of gene silencing protein [Quillaja saponaria]
MPPLRSESGFGRDAGPRFQQERFQCSPAYDSRKIMSRKWKGPEEFLDPYDTCEEWTDDDINLLNSSGKVRFDHKIYRNTGNKYKDFETNEWLLSQDSLPDPHRCYVGFHKHSGRFLKGYKNSSSVGSYKSQHFYRRSALHKQPKMQKQKYDDDEKNHSVNDESSEDWANLAKFNPSEGSEEFNQLVHEAFLMYSKKVNVNRSVQRRYKEQGKACSLYCIVCGRSLSKEFMDTQRLVTHAFMSHKVLPDAEGLAQKEDLVLWPPLVVIHNISMSDNNPKNLKVVSMAIIETILRGNGLVQGRIKVCLGKPADQSVAMVKCLGTFSGLLDAERLHKYFCASHRGRVDFEQVQTIAKAVSLGNKKCRETRWRVSCMDTGGLQRIWTK